MKPIPIPDNWVWPGAHRVIFNPPEDHDQKLMEILPVETLVDQATPGVPRINVLIELEPGDWRTLEQTGGRFWVVFYGGVVPFDVGLPEILDTLDPDFEGGDVLGTPVKNEEPGT